MARMLSVLGANCEEWKYVIIIGNVYIGMFFVIGNNLWNGVIENYIVDILKY